VQDHERDGRAWKTEWHALPEATMMTTRALELLLTMLEGLEVDALRMRANAESTGGFVLSEAFMLALAPMLGRDSAHRLLYQLSLDAQACGQTFAQGVRADATISAHLAAPDVDALLDLGRHTGQCAAMVDRVLADVA
jgi:adenylosuccinate lyase